MTTFYSVHTSFSTDAEFDNSPVVMIDKVEYVCGTYRKPRGQNRMHLTVDGAFFMHARGGFEQISYQEFARRVHQGMTEFTPEYYQS